MKVMSNDKTNKVFKEKDDKNREWATKETRRNYVAKAVMVPLIISHDGAVHKDTVRRWKNFASDIQVDWVRMAQGILRYNVAIVGKFFNKGSWVSEALRKEHPEEFEEEPEGPDRIATGEERTERLHLINDPKSAICAVFGHATSIRRSVDVCWKEKLEHRRRADQSTNLIELSLETPTFATNKGFSKCPQFEKTTIFVILLLF